MPEMFPPAPVYAIDPQPEHEHTYTVIILHGRDSYNEEFANEFFECEADPTLFTHSGHVKDDEEKEQPGTPRTLPALFPGCRWVFPGAPLLPSSRFGGDDMSQWFDMWSTEDPEHRIEVQEPGIRRSVEALLQIVEDEAATVTPGQVILGGISQGAATALAAFLACSGGGLAGFFGFCSWMPLLPAVMGIVESHETDTQRFQALRSLFVDSREDTVHVAVARPENMPPIFLEHNIDDAVVPIQNGRKARDILTRLGLAVEWHEYVDGGHWINELRGVEDFMQFLHMALRTGKLSTIP